MSPLPSPATTVQEPVEGCEAASFVMELNARCRRLPCPASSKKKKKAAVIIAVPLTVETRIRIMRGSGGFDVLYIAPEGPCCRQDPAGSRENCQSEHGLARIGML